MSQRNRQIEVPSVHLDGDSRVLVRLEVSPDLRKLMGDHIYFEYDRTLSDVPPQLMIIPAAAALVPLAWAFDAELRLPVLDQAFYACLPDVKQGLANMFPKLNLRGKLSVDQLIETPCEDQLEASIALFSGGVDSMYTALRHIQESLRIVAVWGIDVRTYSAKAWQGTESRLHDFATRHDVKTAVIRTNLRETINERRISRYFAGQVPHWWLLSIGMSLLGITAPLAWLDRAAIVYLASGVTDTFSSPIGYHPTISNHLRWASTRCADDGSEVVRIEKLQTITRQSPHEPILVCRMGSDTYGGNCSCCEKCVRTMVGLLLSGADPNRHGFRFQPQALENFRRDILRNAYTFDDNNTYFWRGIQKHLPHNWNHVPDDIRESLAWIAEIDLDALRRRSQTEQPFRKRLRKVVGPLIPEFARKPARRLYFSMFRDL